MELQLGLSLPGNSEILLAARPKKRGFDYEQDQTLPFVLLLLDDGIGSGSPNEDETEEVMSCVKRSFVGWPPVKSSRKKSFCQQANGRLRENCSMYVKVKMEGMPIARKVDLSIHHSYEALKLTLFPMFDISDEKSRRSYLLAYQDKEGDWSLAHEHVPWSIFVRSVARLELLKRKSTDGVRVYRRAEGV